MVADSAGFLKKDEEYGVLKLTKKGLDFIKKPASFKIILNNLFEEADADDDEMPEDFIDKRKIFSSK